MTFSGLNMPKPTKILLARRKSELPAPCTAQFAQVVLFVTLCTKRVCSEQYGRRGDDWGEAGRAKDEYGAPVANPGTSPRGDGGGREGWGAGGRARNPYGRSVSGLRRRRGTGKGARYHTTSCEGGGGRRGAATRARPYFDPIRAICRVAATRMV